MNEFAANVIKLIHILFIVWFVITPFTSSEPALVMHLFTAPFLMLHWAMNADECSLTLMEMKLRGIEKCEHSFMWNVVSPIYKPRDADLKSVAWLVTIALWLVTLSKVWRRPGMIKDVFGGAFVKREAQSVQQPTPTTRAPGDVVTPSGAPATPE